MAYAGTSYLVSGGELPWTPEDIRGHLGLRSDDFDTLISTVIASQCINHGVSFHGQVWAVARGDDLADFFKRAHRIGKLVKIGPAYDRNGVTYHDCEYGIDRRAVAKAFRAVINWCWDDLAISNAIIRERQGHYRAPIMQAAE